MTADWSFSLRSATGFLDDGDSDDDIEENVVGDARTSSHLSSNSSQALQQIDLAAREDSAQYKPNPWSIARINAASRPRQPNPTLKSVSENPVARQLPRGVIVDAFKRQAQKPKTTDSSAEANLLQTPSQKPALTSTIDAPDDPVSTPARFPTPIAHITSSTVDPVPVSSQPRTLQQHQGTLLSSPLPRKTFSASHPGPPTHQFKNPHLVPAFERLQRPPSLIPPPPRPQQCAPAISRSRPTPPQASAYFGPGILVPHTITPNKAHTVTDRVSPTNLEDQGNKCFARPPHPKDLHTPVNPERMVPPPPHQRIQRIRLSPRPRSKQPITKASPESEIVSPSPSFAQARRSFGYPALPGTTSERPSPEPLSREESHPTPPSRLQTASPLKKYIDPYDQLPHSPDSEWSTLKPPTRRADGKGKSKASGMKSGKFKLPLSLGTVTPQKKARVITYLPPPPPKKQKMAAEPHPGTRDARTSTRTDGALSQWYFRCLTSVTSL